MCASFKDTHKQVCSLLHRHHCNLFSYKILDLQRLRLTQIEVQNASWRGGSVLLGRNWR